MHKQCPYRREGLYMKDSWMKYDACTLYSNMWDYYDCDYSADYCKFRGNEETLIEEKEARDKLKKVNKLMREMNEKRAQIEQLESEIEEIKNKLNKMEVIL